jgi:hypothetical protein
MGLHCLATRRTRCLPVSSTDTSNRYFELFRTGISGWVAAQAVGVSLSCGSLWFIDAGQPALTLRDDLRVEGAAGVARLPDLDRAISVNTVLARACHNPSAQPSPASGAVSSTLLVN